MGWDRILQAPKRIEGLYTLVRQRQPKSFLLPIVVVRNSSYIITKEESREWLGGNVNLSIIPWEEMLELVKGGN
jgi:hypothetical protein